MRKNLGFSQLYYHGFPVYLDNKLVKGVVQFRIANKDASNDKVIWAMRCMANEIEGKKTHWWQYYVWKLKRWFK